MALHGRYPWQKARDVGAAMNFSQKKNMRSGNPRTATMKKSHLERFNKARAVLPGFPIASHKMSPDDLNNYLSGDKIVCLLCGKSYKALNDGHLRRVHGVTQDQYRERYDIPFTVGLISGSLKKRKRDVALETNCFESLRPFTHQGSLLGAKARKRRTKQQGRDGLERMRGHHVLGSSHPKTTLSNQQVIEIFTCQNKTQKELAQFYKVSQATIANIWKRATWGHITQHIDPVVRPERRGGRK